MSIHNTTEATRTSRDEQFILIRLPVKRRPANRRTELLCWLVCVVLWMAGIALAEAAQAVGHNLSVPWVMLFGGLWALLCDWIREALLLYWSL